jgi:hypothetical protein
VSQAKKIHQATLNGVMVERNRVLRICMAIKQRAQAAIDDKIVSGIAEQRADAAKMAVVTATLAQVVKEVQAGTDYKVVQKNGGQGEQPKGEPE